MAAWTLLIDPLSRIIDKLIPDKEAAARAKLELAKEENSQTLKELEISMSAILAEGSSNDKWTSRARPSFLYVMYVLILWALPMSLVHLYDPNIAKAVSEGFNLWLKAIPDQLWDLFKFVTSGYILGRSWEKVTEIKNK